MDVINKWCDDNNLSINKKKSAILEFCGRRSKKSVLNTDETLNGFPIVESYKYLGTWLNKKLTLADQIKQILNKTYFIRNRLSPALYNASLDFRKNLWQIFVLPMYEFALPIYSAECTTSWREKLNKLLRASFRSYVGLKKTVKLDMLTKLMGYSLEERSTQLKHISEQKWQCRRRGRLYAATSDYLQKTWKKTTNICKGLPRAMIKYVNMQTSLCPICKKDNIFRQSNVQHLN